MHINLYSFVYSPVEKLIFFLFLGIDLDQFSADFVQKSAKKLTQINAKKTKQKSFFLLVI